MEEYTVFILRCGERYALEKRGDKGLLAGLWQFPNCLGRLDTRQALEYAKKMGFKITEIRRQVEKMHIFTHIQWKMTGLYAETGEQAPGFCWLTAEEINTTAALPTAFRQFWEENTYV